MKSVQNNDGIKCNYMAFISEIENNNNKKTTHTHFFLKVVNIYTENKITYFDSFMENHRNHKKIL